MMSFNLRWIFLAFVTLGFGIGLTWFLLFRYQFGPYRPLWESHDWQSPTAAFSESDRERFLDADFIEIRAVKAFAPALRSNYLELNGSRFTMADPGKPFAATDVIYDASLPRKRLVFAGGQDDKFLIHYEQGGLAYSYQRVFLEIKPDNRANSMWMDYCNRAAIDVADLRSMVRTGVCQSEAELRNEALKNFSSDSSRH